MTASNLPSVRLTRADFKVPAMLILLSIVPTLGGVARLASLGGKAAASADNARFLQVPAPVIIHILSATLYCILGALQFSRGLRVRWPRQHRRAGKALLVCGLVAGATGMWMTAFYAIPKSLQGTLLYGVRLAVASAMIACLIVGFRSILQRNVSRHEAFMIRAYALGQGAGTQVLVILPWMLISGQAGGFTRDVLMTLSWAINVVIAELVIRRRPNEGARPAKGATLLAMLAKHP